MSALRPNQHIRFRPESFYDFQGLDTSRSPIALDTGKKQFLARCNNAFCDIGGQIIREPPAVHLVGDRWITHVKFLNANTISWAEQFGGGVRLNSSRDHVYADAYVPGSVVSSVVFGGWLYYASYAQPIHTYDGSIWRRVESGSISNTPPAFLTSCSRRLITAGMARAPTQFFMSRVDNGLVFPGDEPAGSEDVLRAGFIDIQNNIDSGDVITGIKSFEKNRLVVFTSSQPLIYRIDPDIEKVELSDQVSANVGCLSHNTIVNAGNDLLFCSKGGVFSLRRSQFQSISVFSVPMSEKVNLLYRALVANTPNTQAISAAFEQDTGRYHIYFPDSSGYHYTRMSLLVRETDNATVQKWSTANMLNATCADELSGRFAVGTRQGLYEGLDVGQDSIHAKPVEMDIKFPVIWAGNMHTKKMSHSYSLMMDGVGETLVRFYDEQNNLIHQDIFNMSVDEPGDILSYEPLQTQYQRPMEVSFVGLQMRITTTGTGLVRLAGFTINIRE